MTKVVHLDDIIAVGNKEWFDKFWRDLNQSVPVKNRGQLRWYSRCLYERDWAKGVLTSSQQTFAEQLANEYGVEYGRGVPMPVGTKLGIFDKNEISGDWLFRELVGSLM